jgi:hypothetical protein
MIFSRSFVSTALEPLDENIVSTFDVVDDVVVIGVARHCCAARCSANSLAAVDL